MRTRVDLSGETPMGCIRRPIGGGIIRGTIFFTVPQISTIWEGNGIGKQLTECHKEYSFRKGSTTDL